MAQIVMINNESDLLSVAPATTTSARRDVQVHRSMVSRSVSMPWA